MLFLSNKPFHISVRQVVVVVIVEYVLDIEELCEDVLGVARIYCN